ncbi:putative Gtpase activating protein [Leptomonas seymouri]|uniref:Putative Gtpase activating protein n=1 Tax=Leptomonas seymouri TaxID=5684 RepID=A0A0N1I3K2_LEPSE|nr:putative Gtpase activating protein [Leptomonas seymouri]|eukprot:KPI90390.1 putative Gtpase activating protein [Leptomonas seymouri]
MYSSFLERVFGYPPSTAAAQGNSMAISSADPENDAFYSVAPRLSTSGETKYYATTRPYHCSQNHVPGMRSACSSKSGADRSLLPTVMCDTNESVDGLISTNLSPFLSHCVNNPTNSPKQTFSASRSSDEMIESPFTAHWGTSHVRKLLPQFAPAALMGLETRSTTSTDRSLSTRSTTAALDTEQVKRFEKALRTNPANVARLRELSWQGCPVQLRYEVWMFLTGCWSSQAATRMPRLSRHRIEYATYLHSSYGIADWDAVCTLVDSGVDTAVRRSMMKATDTAAAPGRSFVSLPSVFGAAAGEVPPTELGNAASGVWSPHQGRSLASPLATENRSGIKDAVRELLSANGAARAPAVPSLHFDPLQPLTDPDGGQRLHPFLEDASPVLAHSFNAINFAASLETPGAAADASFNSAMSIGPTTIYPCASPNPLAVPDSCSFSPTWPSLSATTTMAVSTSKSAGHQLSASTMLGSKELRTLTQIRKDIPRMSGGHSYLRHPRVQGSIERILFIWSLRHPACGYVQGMNDLVVPFMAVVLAYHFCPTRSITELHSYTEGVLQDIWSLAVVPVAQWISVIEAEVYWLTSYLLNAMQDNYISSHEGITAMIRHLAAVVQVADPPLYKYIVDELQLEFELFSFRWMNCLLLRELTETQSLRLLDAYLSDEERCWNVTHVYTCAALLLRWGPHLLGFRGDYARALKFLQSPPTDQMTLRDFQDVLSESFVLQNLYEDSLSRLAPSWK